ncbi:MAG TPA: hypothetical protein VFS00_25190, partial [Polyangiaceae bacterium]|nr:hypothetical protein [Polyangiaceae bacterium]
MADRSMPSDAPAIAAADLFVRRGPGLPEGAAALTVPGDKSISHRALLVGAAAPGATEIVNVNRGTAVTDLWGPLRALGASLVDEGGTLRLGSLRGPGARPGAVAGGPHVNVGPSSAAARLLIGLLAGLEIPGVVDGDAVLRQRPMRWLVDPLRELGAKLDYLGAEGCLPIAVRGGALRDGRVGLNVGSAQARSGVVLAAAAAGRRVTVDHPVQSRDHTERLLAFAGVDLEVTRQAVAVRGGSIGPLPRLEVPGDPSLA